MISKIRTAFQSYLNTITPTIATAYEGGNYTPVSGTPYQEVYILPADNVNDTIDEKSYFASGIFQINLRYPFGVGVKDIESRIELYMQNFYFNQKITKDDLDIYLTSTPRYTNLGKDGDRIVYSFYVNYRAYIEMI